MAANTLAKKIKQARLDMGLTQSQLAYRMGISAQSISAFESGRIHPEKKYIEKIAQFTHKPMYFFTGKKIAEAMDKIEKVMDELTEIKKLLEQITTSEALSEDEE
jgi:transcriptional regulator with XRE-family HTH domain